jgi:hypothetical protein
VVDRRGLRQRPSRADGDGEGPAPPREVSYHDALELGTHLSALITLYAAFGYQPATVETPDHISVEVDFVAYLRLKEALALAGHDAESAAIARRASSRFVADHLAAMVEPLTGLLAASGVEYLAGASALLLARVGPKPKTTLLPVIRETEGDDEEGNAFGCGTKEVGRLARLHRLTHPRVRGPSASSTRGRQTGVT